VSEPGASVRPERLAAAARALQRNLLELVALRADDMAGALADELGMVPWDREQLLGRVQRDLRALIERRFAKLGGEPVRVVERRRQPLECIAATWEQLRRGRSVAVEAESGATSAGLTLLHEIAQTLGEQWLMVARPDRALSEPMTAWKEAGVAPAWPRVTYVQPDADPELAAYVIARACLRRTGFDPRAVHHAVVAGPRGALERHLRRLWVGARMGGPRDDAAFAGPVSEEQALRYEDDLSRVSAHEDVATLVEGDRLEHAGAGGICLAPALLATGGPSLDGLELEGPLLVLHDCEPDQVEGVLERLAPPGYGRIYIGKPARNEVLGPDDRRYEGALLLERIPPGLPKPRP
jgi:hypothetical protein